MNIYKTLNEGFDRRYKLEETARADDIDIESLKIPTNLYGQLIRSMHGKRVDRNLIGLKRFLSKLAGKDFSSWIVHHINGNEEDYSPSNLALIDSLSHHSSLTQAIMAELRSKNHTNMQFIEKIEELLAEGFEPGDPEFKEALDIFNEILRRILQAHLKAESVLYVVDILKNAQLQESFDKYLKRHNLS